MGQSTLTRASAPLDGHVRQYLSAATAPNRKHDKEDQLWGSSDLQVSGNDLAQGQLIEASRATLDLEQHLENWLERSPGALAGEPLLWIGRQTSAAVEDQMLFPDLIGIDADGKLVIVELKKGRAPREVIAQLLEYAAWAHDLSEAQIVAFAAAYLAANAEAAGKSFAEYFCETFELEEMPVLNQGLRLFIVAEDIPPTVARVCRFLRMSQGMDITCLEVSTYHTGADDVLVSVDPVVGQEDIAPPKHPPKSRWTGEKPVQLVVWEAVAEVTQRDTQRIFSPKEVAENILRKYPTFNKSTIGCQIIADCVNHTSRHHYPGGEDRYWWLGSGKYRLYDPLQDTSGVPLLSSALSK